MGDELDQHEHLLKMLSLFKSKTVFTVCSLGGLALWSRLISPARRAPQSADPTLMSAARRLFSGVCGGLYGRPEEGARAGVRVGRRPE